MKHAHEWLWDGGEYRVCAHCVLVQVRRGKRWRDAPQAIQNYVRAGAFLAVVHHLVTNSEAVARALGDAGKLISEITRP